MNLPLPLQARETLSRYTMLQPGGAVLAGLSGGADSVALLHWLCSIREEYGLGLAAAHVNHGLRGEESDGDEGFCRDFCGRLGVPLHVRRVDVKELARERGVGIEEAGRGARYAFFAECAARAPKAGAPPQVALAHTLSDRAETLLMNIARGAALRGLCSIPPVRNAVYGNGREAPAPPQVVRPLIECTRAQVEEYCESNGLAYRTDSSNFDTGYRRNAIRREAMPLLGLEGGPLRRMFRALEADEAYLAAEAEKYMGDPLAAPEALKGRLLRGMLADAGREPTSARMQELEKQLQSPLRPRGGWCTRLPQEMLAPGGAQKNIHFEPLPEDILLDFIKNLPKMPKEGLADCLDCDTIVGMAAAGRRAAGDSMRPVNGAGTKSFKKLCQERGIPAGARENLALARDALGLVWIEGFGCAHRCRITENTGRAMRIIVVEE